MFILNKDNKKMTNNSLNPAPEFELPFKPAKDIILSGKNHRNTYSEKNIRIEIHDREGRYLYR